LLCEPVRHHHEGRKYFPTEFGPQPDETSTSAQIVGPIVRLDRDIGLVYFPSFCAAIAFVLRALPWVVLSGTTVGCQIYIGSELELFAHARSCKRYWGPIVRPHLGDSVLDVGAGIGETAKTLTTPHHKRWLCLEPDWRMAEQIAHRISSHDLPPKLRGPRWYNW
jgi:hypothetical protein